MKSFTLKLLLFIFPIGLGLYLLPVDERSTYLALEDDCSDRAIWMYDRITNEKAAIKIAFLGSSHTINGIDDEFLNKRRQNAGITNLGYCRLGRDLNLRWLRLLIKHHNLEHIILEVREAENRYSHPVYPFLASRSDVFLAHPWFNRDLFENTIKHLQFRLELTQDRIYSLAREKESNESPYGFGTSSETAKLSELERMKNTRSAKSYDSEGLTHDFYFAFSKHHLEEISALCKQNGLEISFLYLPAFGSALKKPTEAEFYQNHGELWIPPDSIFSNETNWYDANHLNEQGAKALSNWLDGKLK